MTKERPSVAKPESIDQKWVDAVKENEKKLAHLSVHGGIDIGLGGQEGLGRFDRERYFDISQAFFDFLNSCDKKELPLFLKLENLFPERGFSIYFMPRTEELYITAQSRKKYPDRFPDSDLFIGFDALRDLQEKGDDFFTSSLNMARMTGFGRIENVVPEISREAYIEKEHGKPRFTLDEERVFQIIELLERHMQARGGSELMDTLQKRMQEIIQATTQERAGAITLKSREVQSQARVLLALIQEKTKLPSTGYLVHFGNVPYREYRNYEGFVDGERWDLYFSPSEFRCFEAPAKGRDELPDVSRARDMRDEDWISCGNSLAMKLIELLPAELQKKVDRFSEAQR